MICPLCDNGKVKEYLKTLTRNYYQCACCNLIFVPKKYHLTAKEEKKRYDKHENNPLDLRYRDFLSRLYIPVKERIKSRAVGLDFGSGPKPTLSLMFEESGHKMKFYDYFYAHIPENLKEKYDFITASEVAEHLFDPKNVFNRLWSITKTNGYLGVMTKLAINPKNFAKWHYIKDPTHVCFYSPNTFYWLASIWKAELTIIGDDVVIFKKKKN